MDTRFTLSVLIMLLITFQPGFVNADEAKETAEAEPPVEVQLIPVMSLKADWRETMKAKEHFMALTGSDDANETGDVVLFAFIDMGGEVSQTLPSDDAPLQMIHDLSFTHPRFSMVADIVIPVNAKVMEEVIGTGGKEEEVTPSATATACWTCTKRIRGLNVDAQLNHPRRIDENSALHACRKDTNNLKNCIRIALSWTDWVWTFITLPRTFTSVAEKSSAAIAKRATPGPAICCTS